MSCSDMTPYSLGKLIDWKLKSNDRIGGKNIAVPSPYSLGKLIDWKQKMFFYLS